MRSALLRFALVAFAPVALAAQEPVDRAMIVRIGGEAMDHSRVLETFNHLTNVIGPRLTNSPAHRAALEYVRGRLGEWGLSNVDFETWPFGRGWTMERMTLELVAPRFAPLVGYPEAWTPSMAAPVTATPVYLGDKTAEEIEAMGDKIKGAIVMPFKPQAAFIVQDRPQPADHDEAVRSGAPPGVRSEATTPLNAMLPILKRLGAAVILRPNQGQHGTVFVQSGARTTAPDATPSLIMESEHYNEVVRALQSGVDVKLHVDVGTKFYAADTNSANVIAEIPGEDPVLKNEVVLLGAHVDSWHTGTGATDNADAVSSLMETMRILKAIGIHPRRTIRLAIWSGEEEGLLGSAAYATAHYAGDANAAARDAVSVYLNDDPGTGPTYGFYMENNAAAKAIFDAWLGALTNIGMKKNVIGGIGSTDHLSFTRLGIPGFTAIKDYTDYDTRLHHTNVDTYERVDEASLRQSAIVMAVFAYHAAMRNEKIPRATAR